MANNRVTLPKDAERARAASSVEIPNSLQDVASPQVQTIPAYKEPGAPKIPQNLSPDEQSLYQTLIEVKKSRGIESRPTPEVVVITDLAKDYDDLSAMIILKELHRLGLSKSFKAVSLTQLILLKDFILYSCTNTKATSPFRTSAQHELTQCHSSQTERLCCQSSPS